MASAYTEFTTRVTVPANDGIGNYDLAPGEPVSINLAAVVAVEPVGVTGPPGVIPKGPGSRIWMVGGAHFDVTMPYADVVTVSQGGKLAVAAPGVAIQTPDQTWVAGEAVSFALPPGTFTDPEGEALVYTTGPLPPWLSFDAATLTFSGTAPAAPETLTIEVTASVGNASVSETFGVEVVVKEPVA